MFSMPRPNLVSPSVSRGSIFMSVGAVTPLSIDTSLESPESPGSESSLECRPFPPSPSVSGTVQNLALQLTLLQTLSSRFRGPGPGVQFSRICTYINDSPGYGTES
jgi:hypothetical protein